MRDLKRAAVREAMNRSERSFGGYSTHSLPTRNAERVGDNLPPKVEELVKKLEDKGMEPDKAWPIAWSIYCRYKNNDSPSCKRKPEEYFKGRKAFNKFNAPELMGQLLAVLNKHGLDETADKLKRMKVPQLVNDAWVNR
tara:strand:+ start:312 stop:728 length:417 start_codon:yes stop_codon:yes gene_type:complete